MSVIGVPGVQTRERRRWDADSRMRYRHRRQTCTILYYHRSRFHFPPPKISEAPADRKKYVKKGIIVEDVDKCARRGCLSHVGLVFYQEAASGSRAGYIPRVLGVASESESTLAE